MKATSILTPLFSLVASLILATTAVAQPELSLNRDDYAPGEAIVVTFKNGPGNVKDWIAVAKSGQPNDQYADWQYLDGTQVGERGFTDGTVTFANGVAEEGDYEVRMFLNDGYSILAKVLITVSKSPRVTPNKSVYQPNETIVVQFTFGPGRPKDWVGIYPTGGPSSEPLLWFYVDGTQVGSAGKIEGELTFVNGVPNPGPYDIRFFANDTFDLLHVTTFQVANAGPVLTVTPGDGSVRLAWTPVSSPAPVAKYQVRRGPSPAGPFTLVTETSDTNYLHTGLLNGTELCYVVRAVSANGALGSDSAAKCVAPYVLGTDAFIAYQVPPSTIGNQGFNGPLGMDFEVVNPITLTHLGAFDDGANGFRRNITVRLYNRETQEEVASEIFTDENTGVLQGGSRFKALRSPKPLPKGFKGTIVGEGYGAEEQAGSMRERNLGVEGNTGRNSLFFLGTGRTGNVQGAYPTVIDLAPAIAYAAGTFQFTVSAPSAPGKPVISAIPGDSSVTLSWNPITSPLPAASYQILRSEDSGASYLKVGETASSEFTVSPLENGREYCFAVQAIAAGNVVGVPSESLCITPDVPSAGIAYIVPAGTAGNQRFGGAAGNDFDVLRPVLVSQLGAFDDLSDGLKRTITVRLYDRAAKLELAKLVFSPEEPGELIGGSRFKNLTKPVFLPIGFQGAIIASGYGDEERDGNKGVGNLALELFTGGALKFVGRSRWGENPDQFPQIIDGGPMDRYAAGTFFFEAVPLNPVLTIQGVQGGTKIDWTSFGILESAPGVTGPWTALPEISSGAVVPLDGAARFFRVRQ